jgi:hypothetical protein
MFGSKDMKQILTIFSILILFAPCITVAGEKQFPTPEMIGTWTGTT